MLHNCIKYTGSISSCNCQGRAGGHLEFNRDKLMDLSALAKRSQGILSDLKEMFFLSGSISSFKELC